VLPSSPSIGASSDTLAANLQNTICFGEGQKRNKINMRRIWHRTCGCSSFFVRSYLSQPHLSKCIESIVATEGEADDITLDEHGARPLTFELPAALSYVSNLSTDPSSLHFNAVVSLYDPAVYSLCIFNSYDILEGLQKKGIVDNNSLKSGFAHWMAKSPYMYAGNPKLFHAMLGGDARELRVRAVLSTMLDTLDTEHPQVPQAARACGVDEKLWVPFLRAFVCTVVYRPDLATQVPKLVHSLLSEAAVLPSLDQRDNAHTLTELLLAVAAEFGSMAVLTLAVQLRRSFHLSCDYNAMLHARLAMSRSSKREMDWALRRGSKFVRILRGWISHYQPEVAESRHRAKQNELLSGSDKIGPPGKKSDASSGLYFGSASQRYGAMTKRLTKSRARSPLR